MANWSDLKAAVASIVKTNGNKEITGQLLQNVLNNIISNVGLNSSFAGIATPGTNPGTPDGNVFYLATTAGTYSNFNGIVIEEGEAVILEWKGSWIKKDSGFSTKEQYEELKSKILLNETNKFSLVGDGKVQQNIIMYQGKLSGEEKEITIEYSSIKVSEPYENAPAIYIRFYDASGANILNNNILTYGNPAKISIPTNAVLYTIHLFATVIGNSVVGATYSVYSKVWFDNGLYADLQQNKNETKRNTDELGQINYDVTLDEEILSTSENYEVGDGYMASTNDLSVGAFGTHGIYSKIPARTQIGVSIPSSAGDSYCYLLTDKNDNILESFYSGSHPKGYVFRKYNLETKLYMSIQGGCYAFKKKEKNIKDVAKQAQLDSKTLSVLKNLFMAQPYGYNNTTATTEYQGNFTPGLYKPDGSYISSITFIQTSDIVDVPTISDVYYIYGDFAPMNDGFCNLVIYDNLGNYLAGFNIQGRKLVRVPKGGKIRFARKYEGTGALPKFVLWVNPSSVNINEVYDATIKNEVDIENLKKATTIYEGEELSKTENYETGQGYMSSTTSLTFGSFGYHEIYSNIPAGTIIKIDYEKSDGSSYCYLLTDENDNILESVVSKKGAFEYYFKAYDVPTKLYFSKQGYYKVLGGAYKNLAEQVEKNTRAIEAFPTLNFGIDGDSITAGNQWTKYMLDKLGGSQYNVAVGSACWTYKQRMNTEGTKMLVPQKYRDADFVGFGGSDYTTNENIQKFLNNNACTHIEKFIANVEDGVYPNPDVFIFAMGTNGDTGLGNSLGTVDEAMEAVSIDDDSFVDSNGKSLKYSMCGAIRWCIETIKRTYPSCRVFVSLPIQRAQYSTNKNYLLSKNNLIKEMAIQMGCQIIDQYNGCGITSAIELDVSPFGPYLSDGLHPNESGRKLMGYYAAKVVKAFYFN